jgi:hypothetical protein
MLVYSTRLSMEAAGHPIALRVLSEWLTRKSGTQISPEALMGNAERPLRGGFRLESLTTDSSDPLLTAIRLTEPFSRANARQWITECGFRRPSDGPMDCTILLRTEELSARVTDRIQVTRPTLVRELLRLCPMLSSNPGMDVRILDDESIEAFRYVLDDPRRRHPIVLVSPTPERTYLVDAEKLCTFVAGLADVVRMAETTDTFWLAKVIGNDRAAWRGAVAIIYPETKVQGRSLFPTQRILADQLREWLTAGLTTENELLSLLTHRTNFALARQHVSMETVREAKLRRDLAKRRQEAIKTGENAEYVALLEEADAQNTHSIGHLETLVESLEDTTERQQDDIRRLEFELEALKATLAASHTRRAQTDNGALPLSLAEAFAGAFAGKATPEQSLAVVATLFPERLVVLESAWNSAKESASFRHGEKAFELLWKLANAYWTALDSGAPDSQARQCFGNAYAAKESESVMNNRRARRLRTFSYKGADLAMMRHLKIGVKDSITETLRIHFEWDADDRRLVLGHCGPHLDHD